MEYKLNKRQVINGIVLEYFQSTNQSGPMHGLANTSGVGRPCGADNYYNHIYSGGWSHFGMSNGSPFMVSPIYTANGSLAFLYNRGKAIYLACRGDLARDWEYRIKLSFNRTWGIPNIPTGDILENFSAFAEIKYNHHQWKGWPFTSSVACDVGDIYGNSVGFQLKVRRRF